LISRHGLRQVLFRKGIVNRNSRQPERTRRSRCSVRLFRTRRNRGGLDQALAAVWPDSVFTVTKFDRFARNLAEANQILTDLSDRGVLFGLGGSIYDWNDPFGRLFLQTLVMVAEFEANLGHLRTREGMALAKKNGKLKGKQPKLPESAQRSM